MISRDAAETCVSVGTSVVLAGALLRSTLALDEAADGRPGHIATALCLVALTAVAHLIEHITGAHLGHLYRQRHAGSSGMALGALTLPWLFAGLAVQQQRQQAAGSQAPAPAPSLWALHASLAASAASLGMLLVLVHRQQPPAAEALNGHTAEKQRASTRGSTNGKQHLQTSKASKNLVAAALVLLLCCILAAAAATGAGGSYQQAAVLAALAAAVCCCLQSLLTLLPLVFTVGEALVAAQGAVLLGSSALQTLVMPPPSAAGQQHSCAWYVALLLAGSVLVTAMLIPLLLRCQRKVPAAQRQPRGSSSHGLAAAAPAAAVAAAVAAAAAGPAALWALRFALASPRRLLLCCWWAADLAAALPAMVWLNHSRRVPAILVRKGYHLLAVSLFLPALLLEPQLLGVALAAAFALLLAVELLRLSGLPGIAPHVHSFMTSFTDGRDSGLLLVTHFTLLLGMAVPIWLSNALDSSTIGAAAAAQLPGASASSRGQHHQLLGLPTYAGIMIVGFGDTAASAVGSLLGRRPICHGSKKTVEGTAGAVAATLLAWWATAAAVSSSGAGSVGVGSALVGSGWVQLAAATAVSCLLEAVTTQLDNVFVPLHYFALLCLL